MSLHDYKMGLKISAHDYPFYVLIQAAMRQADSENITKLRYAFPEVYEELIERRNSPNGMTLHERIVPAPKYKEQW